MEKYFSNIYNVFMKNANQNNITMNGLLTKSFVIFIMIVGFVMIGLFISNIPKMINNKYNEGFTSESEQHNTIIPPITSPVTRSESIENMEESQKVNKFSPYEVRTRYAKLDEIIYPSSLTGEKGYISRDDICYRYKKDDDRFVKNRYGCMACQVDNTDGEKNYDNTNTNVIVSCVYGDNKNDPSVWSREQCVQKCSTPELKDK